MGDKITLNIEAREVHGKKVAKLRQDGMIPGVVYGAGIEPVSVQATEGEVVRVVKAAGRHTPVHLTGSKRRIAMIKEIDLDPAKNTIRHISFHAVRADEPVTTEVNIKLVGEGESEAEKAGLIVLQALDRIEIKALPMELPEALEVSIVELKEEGDRVTVADIVLPKGVEFVERNDGRAEDDDEEKPSIMDLVVASVYEPSALQAANDAAGGDAEEADADAVEAEHGEEATESKDEKKAE
ncbi:MAG TPA: 50S ribosomal protein L25 [Candidatus Saccharibacteria bacterium]|jgi:large subunit ribosomal protein L25|nr:50S ribosomal protein L25 [Candidatus Saccharibacteria bacterium]HMR38248.1 50S ribosomal protein L25 [Candidatus Saccharibacteria bacterium]